jgi:uncharacterized protein (DUF697 family)
MKKRTKGPHMVQAMTEVGTDEKTDPAGATTGSGTTEMTAERRHELASKMVDRFSLWGGAAGLIPVPLVDVFAVSGVQLQLLRRLSQMYGVPFSENMGKSVLASLMGSMIPATSGMGVTSALKGVPIIGALSTLVMPTLSAGATYAIGKVFIEHFDSGGTLLDFNPPDYREFIKVQKEKWISRPAAPPAATDPAPSTPSKGAKATSA